MLNYVIKTALLSVTLLFHVTVLAASCATGNTDCILQERQLESIKKAGIEPIKAIEASPTSMIDTQKEQPKTIAPIQAFEIPEPITVKPKKPKATKSYLNLDTIPSEQNKSTSESSSTNQQETDSTSDTTTQESTTTTAPTRQQTGIQYR